MSGTQLNPACKGLRIQCVGQQRPVPHNDRMSAQPDDLLMDLIDRVAQRDEAALKALYDLTSSKLYGLSMRVVGKAEWTQGPAGGGANPRFVVTSLSPAEAAMLAGLLQAPSRFAPTKHYDKAKKRMELVIKSMVAEGYLTAAEAAALYEMLKERVKAKILVPRPAAETTAAR